MAINSSAISASSTTPNHPLKWNEMKVSVLLFEMSAGSLTNCHFHEIIIIHGEMDK